MYILFSLFIQLIRYGSLPEVLTLVFCAFLLVLLTVIAIIDKISRPRLTVYSLLTWVTLVVMVVILFSVLLRHQPSDAVDYVSLVVIFTYTMIPVSLRISTLLGVLFCCCHVIVASVTAAVVSDSPSLIILCEVEYCIYFCYRVLLLWLACFCVFFWDCLQQRECRASLPSIPGKVFLFCYYLKDIFQLLRNFLNPTTYTYTCTCIYDLCIALLVGLQICNNNNSSGSNN